MDVSDWRGRIDRLDRKIVDLLNERAACVLGLAPLKRRQAIPIEEPEREEAIHSNLRKHNQGPLGDEAVCRIFDSIMREMKAVQQAESRKSKLQPAGSARPASK